MAQLNLMFPILPGQREAHQAFLAQVHGEKRHDFDARCQRLGVNWERGFYLDGPAGTLFLLVVDVEEPATFLPNVIAAPTAFEQWFLSQAAVIHGLDPAAAKNMPAPELVFDWRDAAKASHDKPVTAIAVPVLDVPGWKGMLEVLKTEKAADFAVERARIGISRETHYLHQTPMGAFTVIAFEGDGLADFATKMTTPTSAFGTWMLEQISKFNGFTAEAAQHVVLPAIAHDFDRSKAPAQAR
jgi:hypothetical protein